MRTYDRLQLMVMFLNWYARLPDKDTALAADVFEKAQEYFLILQDELVNMEKFIDE